MVMVSMKAISPGNRRFNSSTGLLPYHKDMPVALLIKDLVEACGLLEVEILPTLPTVFVLFRLPGNQTYGAESDLPAPMQEGQLLKSFNRSMRSLLHSIHI